MRSNRDRETAARFLGPFSSTVISISEKGNLILTSSAQFVVSTIVLLFGIFVILRAQLIALKLKEFYLNYPVIRYAGEKQLTTSPIYIVVFGVILILIGAYGMIVYV